MHLEGWSLLALVALAMPMKYVLGWADATRVVGTFHGAFFLWFGLALYRAVLEHGWPARRWLTLSVLSFLPFGFLAGDRVLREAR